MLSGEALQQAATQLTNDGVESPRLDAELLLSHVLGVNRAAVLARPDRSLTPKEWTRFRDLVTRRSQREPLAYILSCREFYGLDFFIDGRVLIPRPETELLVEQALRLAGRLDRAPRIADVGAGSGAIAVTLAVHLPTATVYALDESAGALEVVAENARRHSVADRVHCWQGDLLEPLAVGKVGRLDLVTANLPYVATEEWAGLIPEIREYEPRAALDGGPGGLDLIGRLLATAGPYLRPGAAILLEIGAGQGAAVTALARQHFPGGAVQLFQDYAGLDRLLVLKRK
jgi:release factor glutamine methyltransferase